MARKKADTAAKVSDVDAIRHKDTRKNIPTEELRDFVGPDEAAPKTMLYPRDPSLDPQLVWKGKDEQDRKDLAVDVVPIYIQEAIEPRVIVEAVQSRARTGPDNGGMLPGFYDDIAAIDLGEKVEFYRHDQQWANRMILGDSLLVMTSLAEKEGLKGKVQTIYIDPPYGIKYGSNWQVSTRKRDLKDGKNEDTTRQPEQIRAFRDTWKLGIHSYLAYLRERLIVSRELLTETGSTFIQIGDTNVHLVRSLMDEVFGSGNFVSQIAARTTSSMAGELIGNVCDYVVWYAKNQEHVRYRQLYLPKEQDSSAASLYRRVCLSDGTNRTATEEEFSDPSRLPKGARLFRPDNLTNQRPATGADVVQFKFRDKTFTPGKGKFKTDLSGLTRLGVANRLFVTSGDTLQYVRFLDDFPAYPLSNVWVDVGTGSFTDPKVYVVQSNTKLITRCLLMTTDPGDLVLDPTCGSGTTAYVAEQWGRRWITIDTSRVALALARTRIMAAKFPYYLLADSPEGLKKEAELSGQLAPTYPTAKDIRKGFVYKRVPHVTLKSIANNPDIREGMTRAEIDAAIARHAETETLYDQPYEDKSRVRVSGPFTVESLSPDRIVSPDDEERPASESLGKRQPGRHDFVGMILDNLRKAGVQNTFKGERLVFGRLDPYAGTWIQATGEATEADGTPYRVAVSIGPEHGTVTPQQVKEAAKEAVQGAGHKVLIVCGFAFDPHVSEEARRYGALTILPARMNPDLLIGDDLLKKTGAGNLFMVFGEPDIDLRRQADGKLIVEIRGVDVYDPTTGQVRSSSVDDIATWFIDTDYNGECFFVRHAYFLGADDPYGKLKRGNRSRPSAVVSGMIVFLL